MASVKDKVIWITGASSGIGEALAQSLARKGARLILSSRNTEKLTQVLDSLEVTNKDDAEILTLDLSQPETLAQKAAGALKIFSRVDVLIHSGGISQRSKALDTLVGVDRQLMEVNYFSTVALTKAVLPSMISNGYGHIVPISSLVGKFGSPYRSGYSASKHALHGFYDSLRAELYANNILVTIVTPGFVKTNVSINALTEEGKALNQMDDAQEKGMPAAICASKIIRGIEKEKNEVLIGGKETLGVYIKRFFPKIFARIIRKAKVR